MRQLLLVAMASALCFVGGMPPASAAEAPHFPLNKIVNPEGFGEIGVSPLPGPYGLYTSGTTVQLTATPATGKAFAYWTGVGSNTAGTTMTQRVVYVIMSTTRTVTANFTLLEAARFTLTRVASPQNGGAVQVTPAPGQDGKYAYGTTVTVYAAPAPGASFVSWSGAASGSDNPVVVTMNENKTITGNFALPELPHFTLTRLVNPNGSGEIAVMPLPGPDGKYTSGTVVKITAFPASGWAFNSWIGVTNNVGTPVINANPAYVLMNGHKSVTANFVGAEPPRFTLTRLVSPTGAGEIAASPPPGIDGKYTSGTVVTLTAHAGSGNSLTGWAGVGPFSTVPAVQNPVQIVMRENRSVTAYFTTVPQPEPPRFALARIVNPPGSGEIGLQPPPGQDGKYTSGTIVTATARPAPGGSFVSWSGAANGSENPKHILMNENKFLTANFTAPSTAARFTLNKGVTPAGAGEVNLTPLPGEDGKYSSGTVVTVNAHAFQGYRFSHWAGASNSTTTPIQIVMTENKAIYAAFETLSAHTADMMIYLGLSHNPVIKSTPFIMTVHLANNGPSEATHANFEVHLPPGIEYTTSTISQGGIEVSDNGTLLGHLGTLPAGGHAVAGIILIPQTTGTLEIHSSAHADQPDQNLPNSQAHIAVRVTGQSNAASDLTGYPGPIARHTASIGSRIAGEFTFTNNGSETSRRCVVHYYLSSDDVLDPEDALIRSRWLGSLRAHFSTIKKFNVKLPGNAEGRHIIAVLDTTDANLETDEVNNTVVSPAVP